MAKRVRSKIKQYARLVSGGNFKPIMEDVRRWAWSADIAVGLERDVTMQFEPPPARVQLDIRKLDDVIAARLFSEEGLDPHSVLDMQARRRFWEDGIPDAYVAMDDEGTPCYVQWAIPGDRAELIKDYFGKGFPDLAKDELLLEGAWARPEARGKRIMAEAMSRITEAGTGPGHRRAITFVGIDNEPSLRGCRAAGYEVYLERQETWRLGRRSVRWGEAPTTD